MNEMSDEEKSVKLARLVGWGIAKSPSGNLVWIYDPETESELIAFNMTGGGGDYGYTTLYDPANMALAWEILNWALENDSLSDGVMMAFYTVNGWECAIHDLFRMPPAPAQRAWLDKILELSQEAGLVEEVAV